MVVAESFCCGTPVAGFRAGGPEQIALSSYSTFVEYGDVRALLWEVWNMINFKASWQEISQNAKEIYSQESMSQRYMDIYLR